MMQHRRKSARHQRAARVRWPDEDIREALTDQRSVLVLDLRTYGGKLLRIEPRIGYIACRVYDDETDELIECSALKTALHNIADSLPRTLGMRACG